jgi:hypothetical protein
VGQKRKASKIEGGARGAADASIDVGNDSDSEDYGSLSNDLRHSSGEAKLDLDLDDLSGDDDSSTNN